MSSAFRGVDLYGNSDLDSEAKKTVRLETCLALRILELLCIAVDSFVPCPVILPVANMDTHVSLSHIPTTKWYCCIYTGLYSGTWRSGGDLANVPEDHYFASFLDFVNTEDKIITCAADQESFLHR